MAGEARGAVGRAELMDRITRRETQLHKKGEGITLKGA